MSFLTSDMFAPYSGNQVLILQNKNATPQTPDIQSCVGALPVNTALNATAPAPAALTTTKDSSGKTVSATGSLTGIIFNLPTKQ